MAAGEEDEPWLLYDGECPFCSAYSRLLRLRDSVGRLRLVDARSDPALLKAMTEKGFDIDEGMLLRLGGRYYHGADCLHMLALLGSESTLFNRINSRLFSSPSLARVSYPVLRAGRNLALKLLGRSRLKALRPE